MTCSLCNAPSPPIIVYDGKWIVVCIECAEKVTGVPVYNEQKEGVEGNGY